MVLKLDQLKPATGQDLVRVDRTSCQAVGQSLKPATGQDLVRVDRTSCQAVGQSNSPGCHSHLTLVVWNRKDLAPVTDGWSLLGVTSLNFQGKDELDLGGDWEHIDKKDEEGEWEYVDDQEHCYDWEHVDGDVLQQDEGWQQVGISKVLSAGAHVNDDGMDPRLDGPLADKLDFGSRKKAEIESNELAKQNCLLSAEGLELFNPSLTVSDLITLSNTCRIKDQKFSVSSDIMCRNRDLEHSISTESKSRGREEKDGLFTESKSNSREEEDYSSTNSLVRNREQDSSSCTNRTSRISEAEDSVSFNSKYTQSPVKVTQISAGTGLFLGSTEVSAVYTRGAFPVQTEDTNNNSPRRSGRSRPPAREESNEGRPPGCCCQHSQNSALRETDVQVPPGYPVYDILEVKLNQENRKFDYITADGNCFFRAISKGFYGTENFYKTVRKHLVDIITQNKSQFAQFIDGEDVEDHIAMMSQNHCWATTCEIYAAATLLQKDIYMLAPDHLNENYSWLLFRPVFEINDPGIKCDQYCYITLCNTNGNHYDRVVPDHGGCNCFLPHPPLGTIGAP